ncbi:hypothetical protein F2P81_016487 [Scophthalmus maximus]|uniref:Reverse transcriptase domain-containing protein n=1 Tax=Scophthalmus maximus TaxID=52904 RepID=A0A6A4SNN8_SCOMX|nr:hypothetical protein F2P81_016487 [Scophthalmus maximus]
MEPIFAEYPCAIIVDDIIIGGNGIKEHDDNLKRVLDQARPVPVADVSINSKCCSQIWITSCEVFVKQDPNAGTKVTPRQVCTSLDEVEEMSSSSSCHG